MSKWNDDLRRRQQASDVGLWGSPGRPLVRLRPLLFALGVVVLGVILVYVGPVPGLGMFLVIGGLGGALVTFASSWLGR